MNASAHAQPNIALIKYWGKRDVRQNLPAVDSLSITLKDIGTTMSVDFAADREADELTVNGEASPAMLARVSQCLDIVVGEDRQRAAVTSRSDFPIGAGLASSASAFAALSLAASEAAGVSRDSLALARAAGACSGSAARSIYGGFVELRVGQRRDRRATAA